MSPARLVALALALLAVGCAASQEPSVLALDRVAGSSAALRGQLPAGTTAYDDLPGVTRLERRLRDELRAATTAAAADGVRIEVTSGWRSRAYQARLFDEAVVEHGSESAAAAWVARPGTSVHEAGAAVDLGPQAAIDWLVEHGADHGLCQVYANEPWHFELDPDAEDVGCPDLYADPTDDPRLRNQSSASPATSSGASSVMKWAALST
ncbi:D-alanyl-D-alanine carboxypeptidase family protein [Nocardioides sp.]|uniref:D-alanyl-D-alanine carboxypeptidase family protein n=1 Tax=Nocardioides sp. TaxID=35761 RepID=UPI0035B0662C